MIRTSIRKKRRRLICDFHGSEFEFSDFRSFFEFVLELASENLIFIIEIIHGKGKDDQGLPFLPDLFDKRLEGLEEVSFFERPVQNPGMVIVHLANMNTVRKRSDSPFKVLKGLVSDNETDRRGQFPVDTNKSPARAEDRIEKVYKILESSWEEEVVQELLEELRINCQFREIEDVISHVLKFEVFFSSSFRTWMQQFLKSIV